MKKLILTVLLAAVAILAPAASVFGGTTGVDVRDLVGSQWHAVVKNQNGVGGGCDPKTGVCSIQGNWVTISTEGATFDVATELPKPNAKTVTKLGDWVPWHGKVFTYPTGPDFLRQFIRSGALLDTSTLGNAISATSAPSLQPVLSCSKHNPIGTLTKWPTINLAKHWWGYTGCDDPRLAPNVRDWLKALDGKPLPGTLRLNIGMRATPKPLPPGIPGPPSMRPEDMIWTARYWNYNFGVDWSAIPPAPAPECPPGSPGRWPNCGQAQNPPDNPPPPPPGDPGAGLDLAVERVSMTEKMLPGGESFASFRAVRLSGVEGTDTRAEVWVGGTRVCDLDASMPPGRLQARDLSCRFKAPAQPGDYAVRVILNPAHSPAETRYDNNEASGTLTVVDPRRGDSGGTKICLGDTTTFVPCSPDHR